MQLHAAQRRYDQFRINYEDAVQQHEEAPSNYTLRKKKETRQAMLMQHEMCEELMHLRETAWEHDSGYFWGQ